MGPWEVQNVVDKLDENDYVSGPEDDRDGTSGDVWVFKTKVKGTETYIKLKLTDKAAKCLSFHYFK